MIDDGFGDHLSISEEIGRYDRWAHTLANGLLRLPDHEMHDDLVQEARIAMWRAGDTYDPALGARPSWLTSAAKMRMRDVARGAGQPFGHEPVRGHVEPQAESLDAAIETYGEDAAEWVALSYPDPLDAVAEAYHEGEIAQAVADLPVDQRKYVYARFWVGLDPTSRAPSMRVLLAHVPEMADRRLWAAARETLKTRLAHLVDA